MRVVAAFPALGLLAGCAAGLRWPDTPAFLAVLILAAAAAGASVSLRQRRVLALGVSVAVGFSCGGMLLAADAWRAAWRPSLRVAFESMARDQRSELVRSGRAVPEDDTASVVLTGRLRRDAAVGADGNVSLAVDVEWIGRARAFQRGLDPAINPVSGGVLITVGGSVAAERADQWRAGRSIRVPALLHRPARYLNPGVPDQERLLARRGATLVGTVKSGVLVDTTDRGHLMAEAAAAARAFTRRAVASSVGRWNRRSAAIVTAILIGDRTGLEPDVERRLQEAGTYHVIAISGGNIAILAGLTLIAFRVAGFLGRAAMLSAVGGLLAYGYLVGGGASVDRATLMAVVYFLGRAIDLRGPPLNALALVAALLVVSDPLSVADPAFLLTFGATTAILVVAHEVPLRRLPRLAAPVVTLLLASASAEAALMPIGASLFSRVTFAGLALNFAAIPLMAVTQIAGMVVVPLFAVSALVAAGPGWVAHVAAESLVQSADLVRIAPIVTWRVAPPSWSVVAIYYVGGISAWWLWRRMGQTWSTERRRLRAARRVALAATALAALWMLAEPWTYLRARGDGKLHVTFIDVGQGDSALVTFPRGHTMLVDGGGIGAASSFDIGDRVVAPVIRHAGIRRLDSVVFTHGDADHIGGLASSIAEFRPRDVWEGIPVPVSTPIGRLRQAAQISRSTWRNVQSDDLAEIDGVSVAVHHPGIADWERQDVRNEDSIVLELRWRDVSIVLTGDIGRETEDALAARFPPSPLRVIKVAHHGSLTSSSEPFIRALAPRVAIVSVGRRNAFGHPAPAVLDRYRQSGAEIFRTDQDGAVTVDTDGESLNVRTFTGTRVRFDKPPRRHEGHEGHEGPNGTAFANNSAG